MLDFSSFSRIPRGERPARRASIWDGSEKKDHLGFGFFGVEGEEWTGQVVGLAVQRPKIGGCWGGGGGIGLLGEDFFDFFDEEEAFSLSLLFSSDLLFKI